MCSPDSKETERNFWQSLCSSRKYSCFPHRRDWNFPWVGVRGSVQGSYRFSETNFQDFSRIKGFKIHINPYTPKIVMLILLSAFHTLHILVEFNRFPELSRTSALFPGLSSPGKCHNKIPGLSRFSRTRTNPVCKTKNSKKCMKLNWNFQRGGVGVGSLKKSLPWERYGYSPKLHISQNYY